MNRTELANKIRGLLAKGDLESSIELGLDHISSQDLIILSSRFYRTKKEFNNGLMTSEGYHVEVNKLTLSYLEIIAEEKTRFFEHRNKIFKKTSRILIALLIIDWRKVFRIAAFFVLPALTIISIIFIYPYLEDNKNTSKPLQLNEKPAKQIDSLQLEMLSIFEGVWWEESNMKRSSIFSKFYPKHDLLLPYPSYVKEALDPERFPRDSVYLLRMPEDSHLMDFNTKPKIQRERLDYLLKIGSEKGKFMIIETVLNKLNSIIHFHRKTKILDLYQKRTYPNNELQFEDKVIISLDSVTLKIIFQQPKDTLILKKVQLEQKTELNQEF